MRIEQAFYSIIETAMTRTPTLSPELTRYGIAFHTLERDYARRVSESTPGVKPQIPRDLGFGIWDLGFR
jgi:hypothetical protein